MKYIIMTESYDENVGGYIVLHKMCDEINRAGGEAYVMPAFRTYYINRGNFLLPMLKYIKECVRRLKKFKTNEHFNTPVLDYRDYVSNSEDWVVVYPETISGNPMGANNVVRWFLHHPGYHAQHYYYGENELFFKYHSGIAVPKSLIGRTSSLELRLMHYPLEYYNQKNVALQRTGSAYAIRKGAGKKIVHDLKDSILIDGKPHAEVAKIFKRSKYFVSYDTYTAYSTFAVMCGCDSIVIPDEGVDINEWLPDESHRAGIAYGFENVELARQQRDRLMERVDKEIRNNAVLIKQFMMEVEQYFREGVKS